MSVTVVARISDGAYQDNLAAKAPRLRDALTSLRRRSVYCQLTTQETEDVIEDLAAGIAEVKPVGTYVTFTVAPELPRRTVRVMVTDDDGTMLQSWELDVPASGTDLRDASVAVTEVAQDIAAGML